LRKSCKKGLVTGPKIVCRDKKSVNLDLFEAVYKAKKGEMTLIDEDEKILSWFDAARILSKFKHNFWIMFSVYYDLRERGRNLSYGPYENSFTLYMKDKPLYHVFVTEETFSFPVSQIVEWLESSMKMGREPILAIVDKHGDVSYYTLEKFG
jgi:tRNA-intron endonuclease